MAQTVAERPRMGRDEALRRIRTLKRYLVVGALGGFLALVGLAARHIVGVTSRTAPASQQQSGGTVNKVTQKFFSQPNPSDGGGSGGSGFNVGAAPQTRAPMTRTRVS